LKKKSSAHYFDTEDVMTYPLPEGEHLRRAVKWISQNLEEGSKSSLAHLVDQAIFQFDLTPKDGEYLMRFFRSPKSENSADD
jgi:hypothetical protein